MGVYLLFCIVSWYVIKRTVSSDLRLHCGRATKFYERKDAFAQYVLGFVNSDKDRVSWPQIPDELRDAGVINIQREGEFVFFRLSSSLPDQPAEEYIYFTTRQAGGVQAILRQYPNRTVYHIQVLREPGWYYWSYNL
jgi:hypothetical protein